MKIFAWSIIAYNICAMLFGGTFYPISLVGAIGLLALLNERR